MDRTYDRAVERIQRETPRTATLDQRMRIVVDALWDELRDSGVSWIGFYVADESAPDESRLVLGPRRDKPACSPIGLHGVCGAAYRTRTTQIVRDVSELGENYVACDPADRSEIVLPMFERDDEGEQRCWGVLDLDSFDVGAFNEEDAVGLRCAVRAAGMECAGPRRASTSE